MGLLLALFLSGASPHLELRWTPRLPVANCATGGGALVTFTAEIVGGMTEGWYCPEIVWEFTGLRGSGYEEDCQPWEKATEIPRRWAETVLLGQGLHEVTVYLRKNKKTIAHYTAEIEVK